MVNTQINNKEVKILNNLLNEGLGLSFNSTEFGLDMFPYQDNGQDKKVKLTNINIDIVNKKVHFEVEVETLSQTGVALIKNKIELPEKHLEEFLKVSKLDDKALASIVVNGIVNDMKIASKVLNDGGELTEVEPYLEPRNEVES